jgi:homoserine dehydrogenase
MSNKVNVALLGLGLVGEKFAENFLEKIQEEHVNVEIVAVSTLDPGAAVAMGFAHSKVPVYTNALDVVKMGDKVDIIFDLTGDPELRKNLRTRLQETKNGHTVIAPEVVAHLLWNFFGEKTEMPKSGKTGY